MSAREIGLSLASAELRRGEKVEVRVDLPEDLGEEPVEIALACHVRYDVYGLVTLDSGERNRTTREDVAWRQELVAAPGARVQALSFEMPGNVPYTFEGRALRFSWEVSARQSVPLRRDRAASVPLKVLP